jgi:hypothetical protein
LGVYDLIGGVDEWNSIDSSLSCPPNSTDYARLAYDGGVMNRGSFWVKSPFDESPATLDSLAVHGEQPNDGWADLGFRRARTQ